MKKFLAALLALALMLPCALAAAEGVMTDKPISFADFYFGDTFGSIRRDIKVASIDFKYGAYTSRCLADAIDSLPDFSRHNDTVAPCFKVREEGQRIVAGHTAGAFLWFAYSADEHLWFSSSNNLTDENSAVLYGGEYEFETHDNPDSVFADLKSKLIQLYGEPYYIGGDISEALGQVTVDDTERYKGDIEKMQAQYVVWKSSFNGALVVLKNYLMDGRWPQVRLAYISTTADEVLSQYSAQAESGLQGL